MSEQRCQELLLLTDEITQETNAVNESQPEIEVTSDTVEDQEATDCQIALILQQQYDVEHDEYLRTIENSINKGSKVSTSLASYRLCADALLEGAANADRNSADEESDYDDYEFDEKGNLCQVPSNFSKSDVRISAGRIITKHDIKMCEKNNAKKISDQFDISFNCGDISDGRIPNRVYNDLKCAAQIEARRSVRLREPRGGDRQSVEKVLDPSTHKILFRLIGQDRLRSLSHIISSGKEAVIIHANGGETPTITGRPFPQHCAIKVYKTTLKEFKHRRMYVTSDYRFAKNDLKKRQSSKKTIGVWAEKEAINLARMHKRGIPCPEPIMVNKNVLIMKLINVARDQDDTEFFRAAPTLHRLKTQNHAMTVNDWEKAYADTLKIIRDLYNNCRLVHADLSEFNLLWSDNRVWVIDVSQSVDKHHTYALHFLRRDCENVVNFFRSLLGELAPYEDLFNELTELDLGGYGQEFLNNFADHSNQLSQQKRNKGDGGRHLRRDFSDSEEALDDDRRDFMVKN